ESMLGRFMGEDRGRIILASKYSMNTDPDDPNAGGNHRANMVRSLEGSLERLKTDYLDLYWVHAADGLTPPLDVMRALDDQVRLGKILHVGISNAPVWWAAAMNAAAAERGWTQFTAFQLQYNLAERTIENAFFPLAKFQHMAITAWSPLLFGALTGKYTVAKDGSVEGEGRLGGPMGGRMLTPHNLKVAQGLQKVADRLGAAPATVALAWLLHRPAPVIPIVGARNLKQLEQNLACVDLPLDAETLAELDALSPPAPTFPESLLAMPPLRTMVHGSALVDRLVPWDTD
ncbi:MAG: aldo/keto reductase, partial [Gammaproteobacteria bacterium]|nr:aldo/keto reductase [Gammaproteobacteria bacterium]